ncbi:MAG: ABC transporter permease [Oscillospiraceae bacterium]|jgi:ABC-type dipeptide/oligopeptide/nickel transport system permease component|nr:ABC transporter permease [Oscillospiraceae bacterium]
MIPSGARFVFKRLGSAAVTLFLVSVLAFAAFSLIPGDPARVMLGAQAGEEQVAALRAALGLDGPLIGQYFSWLGGLFTGKAGMSVHYNLPLSALLAERLPVTLALAAMSLLMIAVISIPAALFSARREGSFSDRAANALTAAGLSMPQFFLGILFVWVFGLGLGLFAPGAYVPPDRGAAGFLGYMLFPAFALAVPGAAIVTRFLRGSVFQELSKDYVRTALAKGASKGFALRSHVLKNALIPALTLFGMLAGELFTGSVVIEQVFNIPGLGRLMLSAVSARDFPLLQTLSVYIAGIVVLCNTVVDIVMHTVDPRIRIGGRP